MAKTKTEETVETTLATNTAFNTNRTADLEAALAASKAECEALKAELVEAKTVSVLPDRVVSIDGVIHKVTEKFSADDLLTAVRSNVVYKNRLVLVTEDDAW